MCAAAATNVLLAIFFDCLPVRSLFSRDNTCTWLQHSQEEQHSLNPSSEVLQWENSRATRKLPDMRGRHSDPLRKRSQTAIWALGALLGKRRKAAAQTHLRGESRALPRERHSPALGDAEAVPCPVATSSGCGAAQAFSGEFRRFQRFNRTRDMTWDIKCFLNFKAGNVTT